MTAPRLPHSRLRPALVLGAGLLALFTVQRMVLIAVFRSARPWDWPPAAIAAGLRTDLATCGWAVMPLWAWLCLVPEGWIRAAWHRRLVLAGVASALGASIFGLAAEFYFFDEFDSRFNVLAVDYLIYPKEVLTNIWQDYPVVPVALVCAGVIGALALLLRSGFDRAWRADRPPLGARLQDLAIGALLWALLTQTVSWRTTQVSPDRAERELAGNGFASFVQAVISRDLDFAAFYRTLPRDEAFRRARRLLTGPGIRFVGPADTLERRVSGDPDRPRRNLVIIMVESLGSEFWGALGRPGRTLTPRLDALADEGLMFTNIYACGDRTQRGLEGVLSSFPPLPGESVYRRRARGPVDTVARVLRDDGYSTIFLYNGAGSFDGMKPFLTANGFDRFVEQKDYVRPAHVTVWGVSDEDVLNRALEEFARMHRGGRPFFGTILTVSNHKPFTYPKGRIADRPEERTRQNAVRYTDWALGDFFARAKEQPFWKDTVFMVVADHGARVYGALEIPIRTYEIPLLVLGPCAVGTPRRIPTLGCSLDVAPTALGLLGRPWRGVWFGRDLLREPPESGRALINHNRYSGLLEGRSMVVLGLNRTSLYYRLDPATRDLTRLEKPGPGELEVEKDAIALYQTADDLFSRGRVHATR